MTNDMTGGRIPCHMLRLAAGGHEAQGKGVHHPADGCRAPLDHKLGARKLDGAEGAGRQGRERNQAAIVLPSILAPARKAPFAIKPRAQALGCDAAIVYDALLAVVMFRAQRHRLHPAESALEDPRSPAGYT